MLNFLMMSFLPCVFRQQSKDNKQGSEGEIDPMHRETARSAYEMACKHAVTEYKKLLALGVCREQARCILPSGFIQKFIGLPLYKPLPISSAFAQKAMRNGRFNSTLMRSGL